MELIQKRMTRAETQRDSAEIVVRRERKALKQAGLELRAAEDGQRILQAVAKEVQQQAHQKIARIVTRCLETVFGKDAYEFIIHFEEKRNKTEARMVFRRDGQEVDPLEASGGGVVDVASMALRLACIVLSRPPVRRLLVLDEPWKHLSAEYRPAVRELIEELAKEMDFQFIIVTHSSEFEIGKVVRL